MCLHANTRANRYLCGTVVRNADASARIVAPIESAATVELHTNTVKNVAAHHQSAPSQGFLTASKPCKHSRYITTFKPCKQLRFITAFKPCNSPNLNCANNPDLSRHLNRTNTPALSRHLTRANTPALSRHLTRANTLLYQNI